MADRFACPDCGAAIEMGDMLASAEEEIRRQRLSIRALKRQLDKQRKESPHYAHAREAFDYWKRTLGKNSNTIFTEDRERAVLKTFAERTKEQEPAAVLALIKQAIDFIAAHPFVTNSGRSEKGTEKQRHDDLELICREGSRLEKYARLGEELKPARVLGPAKPAGWRESVLRRNNLRVRPIDKEDMRSLFECPSCGATGRLEGDLFECFALCSPEDVDRRLIELDAQGDQFRITGVAA